MIKTFKNYLTELSHPVQTDSEPVAQDWDVKDPGTDDAFEHLNAYVGAVGDREWVSPKIVIKNLHDKMHRLGYDFDLNEYSDFGDGVMSFPLKKGGGTFEVDRALNPYGEFKEGDGITDKAGQSWSLVITTTPSETGKTYVSAEIVRSGSDME
jgi:hypothetical protein